MASTYGERKQVWRMLSSQKKRVHNESEGINGRVEPRSVEPVLACFSHD
jgi:hypothetical protein